MFEFHLEIADIVLRLGLAALLGSAIGLDREIRARPAGLRTHTMTALAAALFTILTIELHAEFAAAAEQAVNADPLRVIEAITAGVAFLAAGAIINSRGKVQGLTTGAAMWLAGAVGLSCGAGLFVIALIAMVLGLVVLTALMPLERLVMQRLRVPDDYGADG